MATALHTEWITGLGRWPTRAALEANLREARRVATTARNAAEDAAADAALAIRRHPLRVVAGAAAVTGIAGVLVGFGAGWCARTRR